MKAATASGSPDTPSTTQLQKLAEASQIGIVLAGGQSRRMGEDKASLRLQGESLLERARRTVGEACGDVGLVLVSGEGRGALSIPDLSKDQGQGRGPVEGIYSAFEWLRENGVVFAEKQVLVCPVDMPLLTSHILNRLFASISTRSGTLAGHFHSHVLPFALRPEGGVLERLRACAKSEVASERSIHAFLRGIGAEVLPVDAETEVLLRNFNTPEEWAELKKRFGESI